MSDRSSFIAVMRLERSPGELAVIIRSPHPPHELFPLITLAEPQVRQFLSGLGQSTLEVDTLIRRANEGPEIQAEHVEALPMSAFTRVSPPEINDERMAMADTSGALAWVFKAETLEVKG